MIPDDDVLATPYDALNPGDAPMCDGDPMAPNDDAPMCNGDPVSPVADAHMIPDADAPAIPDDAAPGVPSDVTLRGRCHRGAVLGIEMHTVSRGVCPRCSLPEQLSRRELVVR